MTLFLRDLSSTRFEVNERNEIKIRREGSNNEIKFDEKTDITEKI